MVDVICNWDNCKKHVNRSPSRLKKIKLTFCCNDHKEKYRRKYRYYQKYRKNEIIKKLMRFAYVNGNVSPKSRWIK